MSCAVHDAAPASPREASATARPTVLPAGRELRAGLVAALLAMGAYCVATALRGTYPFGPRGRAINDLGNQFVPFHAHLWDLAHGKGGGDLFYNWNSGFGVPYLGDFLTYLADPFSWLTVLFPRDAVNLPVFLTALLGIGLGTGLMTHWLGRVRPGSPWLRALLAVGFGLCSWAVNEASPDPMWSWGLVSLPLIGIAVDWALTGRRWVLGSLLVAVSWFGDFYTAAMATLAAGLIAVVRVCLRDEGLRRGLLSLLRAAAVVAVGVALAAPVLLVSYRASRLAAPMPPAPVPLPGFLQQVAWLLPAVRYRFAGPDSAVGVTALLLCLTFPFMRGVPGRERVAWMLLLAVTWASMVFEPTLILWQGGALPNGSLFREVFVFSAMQVTVAWLAISRRPALRELLGGAGLLVAIVVCACFCASRQPGVLSYLLPTVAVGGPLSVVAIAALRRTHGRPRAVRAVGVALALTVFAGGVVQVYALDTLRNLRPFFAPHVTVDAQTRRAVAALAATAHWPASRTDPGPHGFADNDSELLDGQGGDYYSSYVPAETATATGRLGLMYTMAGRHVYGPNDPATRAVFGVTSYLEAAPGRPAGFVQRHQKASPLLTLHRAAPAGARATSAFQRQNDLLGGDVWVAPGAVVPGPAAARPGTEFTASCPAGSEVYVDGGFVGGTVTVNGTSRRLLGSYPLTSYGLTDFGRIGADGRIAVRLRATGRQTLSPGQVGCLDLAALDAAVAAQKAGGPTSLEISGHAFSARLPHGSIGYAVLASTVRTGWTCTVDGGPGLRPVDYDGLFGIPLGPSGASALSCAYTPPGLKAGALGTGIGLIGLLAQPGSVWVRRRSPLFRPRA
ncbi:YfhO family protein [Streptacidiphilus neutrinimicus]|uniref:YfhO family protein n=1 Tax=Streptacidiphilus neutrinimicus TaxID=105420 RepID=UPI0006937DC0|nr:YfhO family protein [Streptacidiphilus neutrinimicus]